MSYHAGVCRGPIKFVALVPQPAWVEGTDLNTCLFSRYVTMPNLAVPSQTVCAGAQKIGAWETRRLK